MKRFLIRLFLFILAAAAALALVSLAYMGTQRTMYRMHTEDVLRYRDMPETIDIAVFGNSQPNCAFRAGSPDERTLFRFCYDAQQLFGDKALYEAYRARFSDGATVIFTLSDFSFEEDYAKSHELEFLRHYMIILPFDKLPLAKLKLYRIFRAYDFDTRDVVAYVGEKLNPDFCLVENGYGEDVYLEHMQANDTVDPALSGLDGAEPGELSDVNCEKIALLSDMVEDAKFRGFRPVLLMAPCYKTYFTALDAGKLKKAENALYAIAAEYGVPFLNYYRDARFVDNADLFKDNQHLNEQGSESFAPIAIADIDAWYANRD